MSVTRAFRRAAVVACLVMAFTGIGKAQFTTDSLINLRQWSIADGGNDHWYAIAPRLVIQPEADSIAGTLQLDTLTGYLSTVLSAAENAFILDSVMLGVDPPSIIDQFWLGGYFLGSRWYWFTNEPWPYFNWAPGEPNFLSYETALAMIGPTGNDPGMWNNATPDRRYLDTNVYWFVVEFGIPDSTIPPPPDTLYNLVQWLSVDGGNNHWYAVLPVPLMWPQALEQARGFSVNSDTAYLATIATSEENAFITSVVLNNIDPGTYLDQLWLGGHYPDVTWEWITGEPFTYSNWAPGEPNNLPMESSIAIRLNGTWNNATPDTTYFDQNFYWSVIEFGPPDTVGPDPDTIRNFVEWPIAAGGNGHWYGVHTSLDIWVEARDGAQQLERVGATGQLAAVTSQAENDFIASQVLDGIAPPSILPQLWIGGYWTVSEWLWVSGDPFAFTNWAPGEPNNMPTEATIVMRLNGEWNNATPDESIVTGNRYWSIVEWVPCCIGATGNINDDPSGQLDLSDLIYLVNYLFSAGPPPPCMAAANINGDPDCNVDLSDLIYLVGTLFLSGPPPAPCIADCL